MSAAGSEGKGAGRSAKEKRDAIALPLTCDNANSSNVLAVVLATTHETVR